MTSQSNEGLRSLVASPPAVCFQYSGNNSASKAELSPEQPGFNLIDVEDWQVKVRTVRFAPPSPDKSGSRASPTEKEQSPRKASADKEPSPQ